MSTVEEAFKVLSTHPDYRVTRRYQQPEEYAPFDGDKISYGLYVDSETTGLEFAENKMIEIGAVLFSGCSRFSYGRNPGLT